MVVDDAGAGGVAQKPFAWMVGRAHFPNRRRPTLCVHEEAFMPHISIRSRAYLLALGAAVLAAIVPAGVGDVRAADAGKIKMVFPGPVTTFSLPYIVARKNGWLGNLEVEDVHVTGDANAMRVLLSGNADIALVGMLNVLGAIHAGASIRAIHSWQPLGDYSLVLAVGKGTKLADLAGKTFASSGPGGLPDQLPRLIMRKHGIDEATTKFVQVGGHAARLQAVIGGRADATLVNTVTALRGVQDGKVTILTRLSSEFPGLGYIWNVVRQESLAKPELAPAFQTMTDIGIKGSRFIMEHPDEAAVALHERLPELDVAFLKAVVRDLNSENLWGVNGGLDPALAEFTADLNMKLGNLPVAPKPAEVLEPRFVDAALKELGPYPKK
jgi:NitT/TauT family transport system substrate-binding protein